MNEQFCTGYEYPRTDKVCIDCGKPHTCSLTRVCETCNFVRRILADQADERDHRETIQSIISTINQF